MHFWKKKKNTKKHENILKSSETEKSLESLGQIFCDYTCEKQQKKKQQTKALNFAIVISIFTVTKQDFGHGHSERVV